MRLLLTQLIRRGIEVAAWVAPTPPMERLGFLTRSSHPGTLQAEDIEVCGNRALGQVYWRIRPQEGPLLPLQYTPSDDSSQQQRLAATLIPLFERRGVDTLVVDQIDCLHPEAYAQAGLRVVAFDQLPAPEQCFEAVPSTQALGAWEVGRAIRDFAKDKQARIDFGQLVAVEPNDTPLPSTYRIPGAGQLRVERREGYNRIFRQGLAIPADEAERVPETLQLGYPIAEGLILAFMVGFNRRTQAIELVRHFAAVAEKGGPFVLPEPGALLNSRRLRGEAGLYLFDFPIVETTEDGRSLVQFSFIADPVCTQVEWAVQRLMGIARPCVEKPQRAYREAPQDWAMDEMRQLADLGKTVVAAEEVEGLAGDMERQGTVERIKAGMRQMKPLVNGRAAKDPTVQEAIEALFDRPLAYFYRIEMLSDQTQAPVGLLGWAKCGQLYAASLLSPLTAEAVFGEQTRYYRALRARLAREQCPSGTPLRVRDAYGPAAGLAAVWDVDLAQKRFTLVRIVQSAAGEDRLVANPQVPYEPLAPERLGVFVNGAGGRIGSQVVRLLAGDALAMGDQEQNLGDQALPLAIGVSGYRDAAGRRVSGAEAFVQLVRDGDPATGPYRGHLRHGHEDGGAEDWIEFRPQGRPTPLRVAVLGDRVFRDPANYPLVSFLLAELPLEAVEATGVFADVHGADKYLWAGAQGVVLTGPGSSKEEYWATRTFVHRVNDSEYHPRKRRVSMASCTTSCASALNDWLQQVSAQLTAGNWLPPALKKAYRTPMAGVAMTFHSYTAETLGPDQSYDPTEKTQGRVVAGGAAYSAPTGFAKAGKLVLPNVQATGIGVRGPWATGSLLTPLIDVPGHWDIEQLKALAADGPSASDNFRLVQGLTRSHQMQRLFGDLATLHAAVDQDQIRIAHITDNWGRPRSILSLAAWYENEWGYSLGVARFLNEAVRPGRRSLDAGLSEFPARLNATAAEADTLYGDRLYLEAYSPAQLARLVGGKTVLVRADYNVVEPRFSPVDGRLEAEPVIVEDFRIRASAPDIQALQKAGARVVIVSHNGRFADLIVNPAGYSLRPVAQRLAAYLDTEVGFCEQAVGPEVAQRVQEMADGDVLLLENLRQDPGEEEGNANFAQEILAAVRPDAYVFVAFGAAHRGNHASIAPLVDAMRLQQPGVPVLGGRLVQRELQGIRRFLVDAAAGQRAVAILGGAKPGDKIEMMGEMIRQRRVEKIVVVGAMSAYFYLARGRRVGNSFLEGTIEGVQKSVAAAYGIDRLAQRYGVEIVLPQGYRGVMRSVAVDGRAQLDDAEVQTHGMADEGLPQGFFGYSVDEQTVDFIAEQLQGVDWIIVNGTAGLVEVESFRAENDAILAAVDRAVHQGAEALILGGDGVAAFSQWAQQEYGSDYDRALPDGYTLSTGGGASLELIARRMLSGLEPLDVQPAARSKGMVGIYGDLQWRFRNPAVLGRQIGALVEQTGQLAGARRAETVVFVPGDLAADRQLLAQVEGQPLDLGLQSIRLPDEDGEELTAAAAAERGYGYVLLGQTAAWDRLNDIPARVNDRLRQALDAGLTPLVLVGENLAQRLAEIERPETMGEALRAKLDVLLEGIPGNRMPEIRLAYAPIWASSKQPTGSYYGQQQVAVIRQYLTETYGQEIAAQVTLGYAGDVRPRDLAGFLSRDDIDFVMATSATADARSFGQLVGQSLRFAPSSPLANSGPLGRQRPDRLQHALRAAKVGDEV